MALIDTPAGMAAIRSTLQKVVGVVDVPEAAAQELATDIQAQLANLPTVIDSPDTYRKVVESLPILKRAEDKVVAFFKDMKDAAHRAHKAITTKESEQLKPIAAARTRMAQLKYGYEQEQDRIRRQQEREAAEQLKRQQEAEALAAAQELAEQGAPEMAEQVLQQAIAAPAPVVVLPSVTAAVDVKGVSKSKPRWVWRYVGAADHETRWKDLTPEQRTAIMALMPREYLEPSESAISKIVTAMSGNIKIPGVEVYDIGSTSVRG